MHPFFEPLSPKETMLLLTALTIGGRDDVYLFDLLAPDVAARLHEKAGKLLEIPADKRVQFMVKEMKQGLNQSGPSGLEFIDPSWLVHQLQTEPPALIACVLLKLPTPIVKSILKRLPEELREALPKKKVVREIPSEAEQTIRHLFLSRFEAMPLRPGKPLTFPDLIFVERSDLIPLIEGLGMAELGQAFVSVGPLALKEFCRRLPGPKQEELILATTSASKAEDATELKSAQRFLARAQVNYEEPGRFFHTAGLWRLAKSVVREPSLYHRQFAQRLPRGPGLILLDYIEKMKEMKDLTPELIERFQDSVLLKMRALSQRGQINPRWATQSVQLHDPSLLE